MSQRLRVGGNTASNLTGPNFKPQTFRSRNECVTARPAGRYGKKRFFGCEKYFHSYFKLQQSVKIFVSRFPPQNLRLLTSALQNFAILFCDDVFLFNYFTVSVAVENDVYNLSQVITAIFFI